MNYVADIALLAYSPAQAETLLHSLERADADIGRQVNALKTEYMSFNQRGDISTLNGGPLKLADKFTYLRSSVSSTKNNINTWLAKARIAIDRLSVIWKPDLTDKIKRSFFPSSGRNNTAIWMHHMDANETYGEKAWRQVRKNVASNIEQVLEPTSHKTAAVRSPNIHHESHPNETNETCGTLLREVRMNS